jgi:hypothetical protein
MFDASKPEFSEEHFNSFEMVDQIGNILKEDKNGIFQSKIEQLYVMASYLTYCYEANAEIHSVIYTPMYNKYKNDDISDNTEEQFNNIVNLLDKYRKEMVKMNRELDIRAMDFAKDCLAKLKNTY